MSLESRLRQSLHGAANEVHPDIETRLGETVRVERRRRITRRIITPVAIAAVVAGAWVGGRSLIASPDRARPAESPRVTAAPVPAALAGRYERLIPASAAPGSSGLAGRYELHLGSDGTLELRVPDSFAFGKLGEVAFRVVGDRIVSGAYFNHCGTELAYRWTLQGDSLRLSTTAPEPCRYRRILFTGGPWTRIHE